MYEVRERFGEKQKHYTAFWGGAEGCIAACMTHAAAWAHGFELVHGARCTLQHADRAKLLSFVSLREP